MTSTEAGRMASALPEVQVRDHFGSDAYSVGPIFATVWHDSNAVNLNLTPELQERFLLIDGEAFTQIPNAWGRRGWTRVQLEFVDADDFGRALRAAWERSKNSKGRKRTTTAKKKPITKKTKKRPSRD